MANKGSALLSALFIMTLVAIAATAMSIRLQQDIQHTQLILSTDKLYLATQSATSWAMGVLKQPMKEAQPNPIQYPKARQKDYPGIVTTAELLDLQARFNLNQLVRMVSIGPPEEIEKKLKATQAFFLQLLTNVLTDEANLEAIVLATTQWVNEPPQGQGETKAAAYYLRQNPPYSPSYQPMQSISEFRLVQGVNEKIYQRLQPFLTTLPQPTLINLNSAPLPVLMSLGPGLDESEAQTILSARGENGFKTLAEANELLKQLNIPPEQVTLESNYFLCITTTRSNDLELTRYTILKRIKTPDEKISVFIIHDTLNDV